VHVILDVGIIVTPIITQSSSSGALKMVKEERKLGECTVYLRNFDVL
jgi:hypothetical protein